MAFFITVPVTTEKHKRVLPFVLSQNWANVKSPCAAEYAHSWEQENLLILFFSVVDR